MQFRHLQELCNFLLFHQSKCASVHMHIKILCVRGALASVILGAGGPVVEIKPVNFR